MTTVRIEAESVEINEVEGDCKVVINARNNGQTVGSQAPADPLYVELMERGHI